jgi:hypothetical protein
VCVLASGSSATFAQTQYGCNYPSTCPSGHTNPFTSPLSCGLSAVYLDSVLGGDTPLCGSSTSPCASFSQALVVGTTSAVLHFASGTYTGAANCGQVISNGNYSLVGYGATFSCPGATWLTLSANVSATGVTVANAAPALSFSGAISPRFTDCVFRGSSVVGTPSHAC